MMRTIHFDWAIAFMSGCLISAAAEFAFTPLGIILSVHLIMTLPSLSLKLPHPWLILIPAF